MVMKIEERLEGIGIRFSLLLAFSGYFRQYKIGKYVFCCVFCVQYDDDVNVIFDVEKCDF